MTTAPETEGSVFLMEDLTTLVSLGTSAFGLPSNPDLLYDPVTGNVQIDADGSEIVSFNWDSNGQFTPVADFSDLDADVGFMAVLTDNTTMTIGWVSSGIFTGVGFDGPAIADIGNIFPTGLDVTGLQSLLTENTWAGPIGSMTGGSFDLVVVPELNAFIYLFMSSTGVVLVWIGRRCWRRSF